MKHVVRISILMLGLLGSYVSASIPQVPSLDGGPILTDPKCPKCGLPPMVK
jgi:hypothetical protein